MLFLIDRKEAVPLLVSSFFSLFLFFIFLLESLKLFHFFLFLLKAQTTKIEDEKAGSFYVGRAEETWNSSLKCHWHTFINVDIYYNNRS